MRFIHSADWQIGKVYKQFGAKEESLRQSRLAAIERLGALAVAHGARHVFVAGDIYDSEAPTPITLRAPIERMKPFSEVQWHLLPGNHDPHRPEGVWDRLAQMGVPAHIHLRLTPAVVDLDAGAALLPAPLTRKTEFDDITAWMDAAATPAGVRSALAWRMVRWSISGAKARRAILCRAGRQENGTALLVEVPAAGAAAEVTPLSTGTYRWVTRTERLADAGGVADLEQRLRGEPDLSRLILRLQLDGHLPIAAYADLQNCLVDLEAAVFHLDVDQSALVARPTEADLEAIDFDGVLRRCADLKSLVDDTAQTAEVRHHAEEALVELYLKAAAPKNREAA